MIFFKCSIIVGHGKRQTSGGRDDEVNNNERRRRFKNNIISFTVFHTDGREFNNIKYFCSNGNNINIEIRT